MIKISEIEQRTYEEIREKFIECGFTKEDYEKTEKIEKDKTILWISALVAKHFKTKPYELLTSLFVGSIASYFHFGKFQYIGTYLLQNHDTIDHIKTDKNNCEFCEGKKNLFLTRECFDAERDSSEMIIEYPHTGNVIIASEDSYSIYEKPTRTIRRITINYCPICGRKLK